MKQYRVAIVGAGPAGYFAAQALQNLQNDDLKFAIDLIERLPTPWGLVRSGVAPDHPKIKTVSKTFEKIATAGNVNLFANIEVGKDLAVDLLKEKYDAVVFATGSTIGKKLGIPGENLRGYISAAEFVPWYNGHPDYANLDVLLNSNSAVVIGAGNVAMDCGRILALDPKELEVTDTAQHAIDALHKSEIRHVYICARRSAEFAAFTSPELRELPELEHTNVLIHKEDIEGAISQVYENAEKSVKSNLDAMQAIATHEPTTHARTLEFLFNHVPVSINGTDKVESVTFKTPNGEETIECGLVISAIGYQAFELSGIPFQSGKVRNEEGFVEENVYVVGWAKRGPSGVIGTNKSDAAEVMKILVSKLSDQPKSDFDLSSVINGKVVTQNIWEKINAAEIAAGEPLGKPRVKAISVADLLNLGGL